jgi:hypothetical protein
MDVAGWLRGLGLAQYEAAFREAAIGPDVLPDLTDSDLEKLGIALGDRKPPPGDRKSKAGRHAGAAEGSAADATITRGRRRAPTVDGHVLRSRRLDRADG